MKKSIILLSGGLDSTVSAAVAKKRTKPLFSLTFDYGQRAARMEILASKKISRILGMKHKVVKLNFFKEFKGLTLLRNQKIKNFRYFNRLKNLWVPNRNALFINIAACFAEYYGAELIVTGFNQEEAREFPDNRPQFIDAINKTLRYSTLTRTKVVSYLTRYSKLEIYKIGLRYQAPLQFIYSCYLGDKRMCGRCASCKRLKKVEQTLGLDTKRFE